MRQRPNAVVKAVKRVALAESADPGCLKCMRQEGGALRVLVFALADAIAGGHVSVVEGADVEPGISVAEVAH